MSRGEFELIAEYFSRQSRDSRLSVGNGDDAAVITGATNLAVSSDTLVEGVHFPENANPELIARRALRVNLSDMAAMGARPQWFTLALTLPDVDDAWLSAFSRGLWRDAENFGCELIGGDTTRGPLNIGIHMMGEVPDTHQPIQRSTAKAGDLLVVTGTLGDAGAALRHDLNGDLTASTLLQRYWLPSPRIDFTCAAGVWINAALDISDGLVADVGHICQQSQLAATIDSAKLPLSGALLAQGEDATIQALTSGDDYELCMAVPAEHIGQLQALAAEQELGLSVIGQFSTGRGVTVLDQAGQSLNIGNAGYRHFP